MTRKKRTFRVFKWLSIAAALLTLTSVGVVLALRPVASSPQASVVSPQDVHNLINQERRTNGLNTLTYNTNLQASAQWRCNDMLTHKYYDHTSSNGQTPQQVMQKYINVPITSVYSGENIADGQYSSQSVVGAWLASPEHKANILNKNYTDEGVAVCNSFDITGGYLVVEDFAQFVPQQHQSPKAVASSTSKAATIDCTALGYSTAQANLARQQTLEQQHQQNLANIQAEWANYPSEAQLLINQEDTNYQNELNNMWASGAAYLTSKGCNP